MKNLLLTALVGLLVLNPFSSVTAPLTPQQCGKMRKLVEQRPFLQYSKVLTLTSVILAKCNKLEVKLRSELNAVLDRAETVRWNLHGEGEPTRTKWRQQRWQRQYLSSDYDLAIWDLEMMLWDWDWRAPKDVKNREIMEMRSNANRIIADLRMAGITIDEYTKWRIKDSFGD